MDAYAGKIADIDLTRKKVTITATPSDWKKRYLGGRGFGARVVTDRVNPRDDPCSKVQRLIKDRKVLPNVKKELAMMQS